MRRAPWNIHGLSLEEKIIRAERWLRLRRSGVKSKGGPGAVDLKWTLEVTPEQEAALQPRLRIALQALRDYYRETKVRWAKEAARRR